MESPQDITLYFSLSTLRSAERAQRVTEVLPWPTRQTHVDVFSVSCGVEQMREVCVEWCDQLPSTELENIRCHLTDADSPPSAAELMNSQSLRQVIDQLNGYWLERVLARGQLVTYFQPIVDLQDPTQAFAYECLIRGRDNQGGIIPPDRLFNAARATGKIPELDHAARMCALRAATVRRLATGVFINFNPRFLEHSFSKLQETIDFAEGCNLPTDRCVFEVVESDEIEDIEKLARIIDYCRQTGWRVALDDVGAGYNSLNLMSEVQPDYIKIDRQLITDVHRDPYRGRVAGKLLELARELRIRTVVEGIEVHEEWEWAVQHGADFGQGFFFARPAEEPPLLPPDHCDLSVSG